MFEKHPCESRQSAVTGVRRRLRAEHGFTLVEVSLVAVILMIIMGSATSVISLAQRVSEQMVKRSELELLGRSVISRLSYELGEAAPSTILPVLLTDSNTITFQKVLDYDGLTQTLSPAMTFSLSPEPGEIINGLDDNEDGRVDESFFAYESEGAEIMLAHSVLGLRFNAVINGIEFTVDVGGVDREGDLIQFSFSGRVTLRIDNP